MVFSLPDAASSFGLPVESMAAKQLALHTPADGVHGQEVGLDAIAVHTDIEIWEAPNDLEADRPMGMKPGYRRGLPKKGVAVRSDGNGEG
jgi:hypothetical protein